MSLSHLVHKGHFREELFQAVSCTASDNKTQNKREETPP